MELVGAELARRVGENFERPQRTRDESRAKRGKVKMPVEKKGLGQHGCLAN